MHITTGCGKLDGIHSINTSSKINNFCKKMRSVPDSICSKCYAMRYESYRPQLHAKLIENTKLFINPDFIPKFINYKIIRFHSFGELINLQHFTNYVKLCEFNPTTHFTLFTKRLNLIRKYVKSVGKIPDNLKLIYSNPSMDKPLNSPPLGFHAVFNVFTIDYIESENIAINCKGSCADCIDRKSVV
jgi:hypothetical protein